MRLVVKDENLRVTLNEIQGNKMRFTMDMPADPEYVRPAIEVLAEFFQFSTFKQKKEDPGE